MEGHDAHVWAVEDVQYFIQLGAQSKVEGDGVGETCEEQCSASWDCVDWVECVGEK